MHLPRSERSSGELPTGAHPSDSSGWIIPLAAVRTPQVKFMILWSAPLVTTLEQLRFQFPTQSKAEYWEQHTETEAREHIRSDPDRYALVATDPADSLRRLNIPGLWLYGSRDVSVPAALSIERLEAPAAGGKPFEHVLFPGLGHSLSEVAALPVLLTWLKKTVTATQRDPIPTPAFQPFVG